MRRVCSTRTATARSRVEQHHRKKGHLARHMLMPRQSRLFQSKNIRILMSIKTRGTRVCRKRVKTLNFPSHTCLLTLRMRHRDAAVDLSLAFCAMPIVPYTHRSGAYQIIAKQHFLVASTGNNLHVLFHVTVTHRTLHWRIPDPCPFWFGYLAERFGDRDHRTLSF